MVHATCIEFTLDNDDLPLLVIDDDCIKLFIVRTVRNVVFGLDRRTEIAVPQIPSEKLLAFVGKILLIVWIVFEIGSYSLNKGHCKAPRFTNPAVEALDRTP